ncbi:MAG: hypothetical protein JEY96_01655 [Bacteroidales bacterium]|nr:hypothetical protein [Bacteroidales bacterium]
MGAPKLALQPDEIKFLKENFFVLNNAQLAEHINKFRAKHNQYSVSGLRSKCKLIGLTRGFQIRWCTDDINKMKAWYPLMGDTQISDLLNKYGISTGERDGKQIKRTFTKKHIEKKRTLLGLSRTKEQIQRIISDNRLCGDMRFYSKDDNTWTRGYRKIAAEEDTRIWDGRRVIKINGHFIPYTRWFYNKFIAPVPAGKKVYHIDLDPLNDDAENLELRSFTRISLNNYKRALPLIDIRLRKEQRKAERIWDNVSQRQDRIIIMKEIARLTSIKEHIESKLTTKPKQVSQKFYEPMEAF